MDSVNKPNSASLQNGQEKGAKLSPTFEDLKDLNTLKKHIGKITLSGQHEINVGLIPIVFTLPEVTSGTSPVHVYL